MIKNRNTMKIKALLLSAAIIASVASVFSVVKKQDGGDVGTGGIQIYSQKALLPSVTTVITAKSDIEIVFTEDMGIVNAAIKNNTGLTISRLKADTSVDTDMHINISNLPGGSYTLIITNLQGIIIKSEVFTVD